MSENLERLKDVLADRYAVERELGRGGMATVYLAYEPKHDRKVAIKVLNPDVASAVGAGRFLQEIQIEANLQHPNILPLHDSGESDGVLYYVMPYVEGESLRDRLLREKELPLEDALRITREVGDALSYAHDHGVIHRDIKPENIMLTGDHAVLADFGIARAIDTAGGERVTKSGHFVGTPMYMSPEQAAGGSDLDARSDAYSLACVLFEMICGEPPFGGRTVQAVLAKHMLEPAPSMETLCPSIPHHVAKAVERGLSKTPAERFSTTAEFVAALEGAERPDGWVDILRELGARNIWHIGALYLVLGFIAIELARMPIQERALPTWVFAALFALVAIGFPITLALAWAQGKPRGQIRPRWVRHVRAGYSLAFLGTVVIGLLAVRAALTRTQQEIQAEPIEAASTTLEQTRIAVLPFEDLSEEQALRGLCAGFTRTLISELTQIDPLDVISYNGVKHYRNSDVPLDSIAQRLRVGTIVSASVQESQGELRVTVELTDAASMSNLATSTIGQPRTETFALQADIVKEVSRFLREQLGVEIRRQEWLAETASREAWELVQEAEVVKESVGPIGAVEDAEWAAEQLQTADSLLALAESLDPTWLEPVLQRGWIAADQARLREASPGAHEQNFIQLGLALSERALALEPEDAGALELQGVLSFNAWGAAREGEDAAAHINNAEEASLAAVERDPSKAMAWVTLSEIYRVNGLLGSAFRAARSALEADAFLEVESIVYFSICQYYWENEELDRAMPCFAEGRQRFPDDPAYVAPELTYLAFADGPEPDVEEAWQINDTLEGLMGSAYPGFRPSFLMMIAAVLARAGEADSAHALMRRQTCT
jgi:serine/threonine-protein kinase